MTLRKIIEGVRPKKPIFAITRGYTEELWEMTTACWEEDPAKRPPVDHVLGMLRSAAGQWKPKYGELAAQDDWSPTSPTEGSDLENESEPFTPTSASSPQQLATETLPPAPTPAIRAPLGEDEVREVAKTLEEARRMHIYPWIGVSNQRTTDVTRYSPRFIYHPWIQDQEAGRLPRLLRRFL